MILNTSTFSIQDKNARDLDNEIEYPTLDDYMKEQNKASKESNTVHRRRDLDSLG